MQNENLLNQIEQTKKKLISLEKLNGKKDLYSSMCKNSKESTTLQSVKSETFKKKEELTKKCIEVLTDDVHVGQLDMRVGRIVEVSRHPNAETLYVEKINCGEAEMRTVCSGLVNNMPIEELENRLVVILCNLKPAKMRGITSEAMVMCAVSPEKTEVLDPPVGAIPGDLVHCEGYSRKPDIQLSNKNKTFEKIASNLKTNENCVACYKTSPLVVLNKGQIVAQTLKNIQVK